MHTSNTLVQEREDKHSKLAIYIYMYIHVYVLMDSTNKSSVTEQRTEKSLDNKGKPADIHISLPSNMLV